MKTIIRGMYLALFAAVGLLAITNDASSFEQAHPMQEVAEHKAEAYETNLEYCDVSKEILLSPEVQALALDTVQLSVLSAKLCPPPVEEVAVPDEPSLIIEPNRVYHGQAALKAVRQSEGELTPEMEHVVLEEGYVLGDYHDTGEIYASGVGQTGKFKGMSFKESFQHHRERALKMFPELDSYSEELRKNIISSTYRGGITGSPKTRALIVSGCYDLAAEEFLNNREYRKAKAASSGIAKRMERLSTALSKEKPRREAKCGSKT